MVPVVMSAMVKIRLSARNIAPLNIVSGGNRADCITVMHRTFSEWTLLSVRVRISTAAGGGIA